MKANVLLLLVGGVVAVTFVLGTDLSAHSFLSRMTLFHWLVVPCFIFARPRGGLRSLMDLINLALGFLETALDGIDYLVWRFPA